MENKSITETFEDKKQRTSVFNLTSDLFAGKVFEDIDACQELCRILLKDDLIVLRNVKTQYVIRKNQRITRISQKLRPVLSDEEFPENCGAGQIF